MKKVTVASLVSGLFVFALCLVLPLSASAVDKLIVKDASGVNTVFVVNDLGQVGARTATPQATLHVVDNVTGTRGLLSAQHSTDNGAAVFIARKSRGTEAAQTAVATSDYVAAFHGQGYDGSAYQTTGTLNFIIDGAVSPGNLPMAILLSTGTTTANKTERLRISSSGFVTVNSLGGSYGNGSAYVCVNNAGQLFASESACP